MNIELFSNDLAIDSNTRFFTFNIPRRYGCTATMELIRNDGFSDDYDIHVDIYSIKEITSKTVLLIDDYYCKPCDELHKLIFMILKAGGYVFRFGQPTDKLCECNFPKTKNILHNKKTDSFYC